MKPLNTVLNTQQELVRRVCPLLQLVSELRRGQVSTLPQLATLCCTFVFQVTLQRGCPPCLVALQLPSQIEHALLFASSDGLCLCSRLSSGCFCLCLCSSCRLCLCGSFCLGSRSCCIRFSRFCCHRPFCGWCVFHCTRNICCARVLRSLARLASRVVSQRRDGVDTIATSATVRCLVVDMRSCSDGRPTAICSGRGVHSHHSRRQYICLLPTLRPRQFVSLT